MANLATRLVQDELVVLVHGAEGPSDGEWDEYLEIVRSHLLRKGSLPKVLVYSAGGGPSPLQRQRAVAITTGHRSRVALVTRRAFPRGVAAVASWFGVAIRPFSTIQELPAALDYLELEPVVRGEAERTLAHLAAALGVALE